MPHRLRQVGRGDKEHINAVHFENVVQVVQGRHFLNEHDDHRLVVGPAHIIGDAERLAAAEHSPVAQRRELGGAHGGFGCRPGVDVR